ncbi:hypothetical protein KIM372_04650 [Bombiscardovia nodaiensis]|uniref:Uncharacterized protein n=1 Tax=Bombiscardovia nodaiensis TaxID=2932181 RepID=A0ABN6SAQ6_9BIFI|nr:hypothetical protein KIM372_04650 [Bombiscardovia nodaiensis]
MKKENFVALILSTIGVLLFALGMCMCLVPNWHAVNQGVIMGGIGLLVLLIMVVVRRRMQGKAPIVINARSLGIAFLAVAGALVLGLGMCMTMVWQGLMVPGVIVGIVGIVMLLALIPLTKGLR